ncbi:cytochrome and DOMON domain-containing protein [Aspergillus mulundensis]|uniref:Cytochrome b561 domain-containing protein n=1 Tax=Aspergillus mulundensis TaxID=1810919 RepID=A0A3D8QVM1_9EURO|nr:Uncharacterized protein DSM5745_09564 [Aspergillus mulundensis]RDW65825.1 Uncharacterized protein DSM5745_09564 [Aspergillus mulundensis]
MQPLYWPILRAATLVFIFASRAVSEPVQYCRFGHEDSPDATIDFCLGISTFFNSSSNNQDLYMSIHVTKSSALGWTALGTGSMMAGSLMFIVYGDPFSSELNAPAVSVRTIDGHHQPHLLSSSDTGGAEIRVVKAEWASVDSAKDNSQSKTSNGNSVSVAEVAIICYSFTKWPGSPIDMDATAQPWIWAWNKHQEFDTFADVVHLDVHEHHAETGGWGRFYVDMARAVAKDILAPLSPPIRPGVATLGAWDIPGGWSWRNSFARFHGFIMSAAFLLCFPAGVVAMRSGSSKSFRYHWILQLIASTLVLVGVAIGLLRAHKISSPHHYIGLIVALLSLVQIWLGWRHHVLFVRIKQRQWASHGHIWLGRVFLLLGWTNIITGLFLTGRGWSLISLAASYISIAAVAVSSWVWYATRQRKQRGHPQNWEEESPLYALEATRDDYFAIAPDDDDESELESSNGSSKPVKLHKSDAE